MVALGMPLEGRQMNVADIIAIRINIRQMPEIGKANPGCMMPPSASFAGHVDTHLQLTANLGGVLDEKQFRALCFVQFTTQMQGIGDSGEPLDRVSCAAHFLLVVPIYHARMQGWAPSSYQQKRSLFHEHGKHLVGTGTMIGFLD
jgi:hypothetical protein